MNAFTGTERRDPPGRSFFAYRASDRAMLEAALELHRAGAPVEPTTWIRASVKDVGLIAVSGSARPGCSPRPPTTTPSQLGARRAGGRGQRLSRCGHARARRRHSAAASPGGCDAGAARVHAAVRDRRDRARERVWARATAALSSVRHARPGSSLRRRRLAALGAAHDPRTARAWAGGRGSGVPPARHDTHLVVANCLAAVQAGCAAINGTLLGKGERSGNAPLEGVLLHLMGMVT